jgi:hypothetical protein
MIHINQTIVGLINFKGSNFSSGAAAIEHAATNIASFWLDHSTKCVEKDEPIMFFSDCAGDLVKREYGRQIYSGVTVNGDVGSLWDETIRLAISEVYKAFESGKYLNVKNRVADMNEANEILRARIKSAFAKQV